MNYVIFYINISKQKGHCTKWVCTFTAHSKQHCSRYSKILGFKGLEGKHSATVQSDIRK